MGLKKCGMKMVVEIRTRPGRSQDEKGDFYGSRVMVLWYNMFFESLGELPKTI
jgi:hypothetical protein